MPGVSRCFSARLEGPRAAAAEEPARNVILFVGDGLGAAVVSGFSTRVENIGTPVDDTEVFRILVRAIRGE